MIGRRPLLGALARLSALGGIRGIHGIGGISGIGGIGAAGTLGTLGLGASSNARGQTSPPASPREETLSDAPLRFPRDHGAHPETRVEWWYVTGVLYGERQGMDPQAPLPAGSRPDFGFQLTFFRVRNDLRRPLSPEGSAFSPAQLMLAHAAVSDLGRQRLLHDEQVLRHGFANARAETDDTRVRLTGWRLARSDGPAGLSRYTLTMPSERGGFALALTLDAPQTPLLQGREGWSRKGPGAQQASRYVSEPQLSGGGQLALREGGTRGVRARAWLDHEWSNQYLGRGAEAAPDRAVGWDWLGLNLDDGSSMTLFQMRGADGAVIWTGGSWRSAPAGAGRASPPVDFEQQLRFEPLAHWRSPVSLATYPTRWRVHTPRGVFLVEAAYAAQEVDARRSTGFPYWEGVARLADESGRTLGWGYLEMTGYAGRVPL